MNVANGGGSGLGRDGGMAEYLLVPAARHLVPLGGLDPRVWAPLDDAALTPYHALKRLLPLCTPDNWVMVMGIGGLGHVTVQLVKELTGARVIAIDIADDKLALAADLGADAVVRGDAEDAAARVKEATGGQGVAAVIDCVGNDATLALAAASVHSVSHIVIVGVGLGTLPVNVIAVPWETTVSTTFWGGISELRELVAPLGRRPPAPPRRADPARTGGRGLPPPRGGQGHRPRRRAPARVARFSCPVDQMVWNPCSAAGTRPDRPAERSI